MKEDINYPIILIAEDDGNVTEDLVEVIKSRMPSYRTLTTQHIEGAVEIFGRIGDQIRGIILDMLLPANEDDFKYLSIIQKEIKECEGEISREKCEEYRQHLRRKLSLMIQLMDMRINIEGGITLMKQLLEIQKVIDGADVFSIPTVYLTGIVLSSGQLGIINTSQRRGTFIFANKPASLREVIEDLSTLIAASQISESAR